MSASDKLKLDNIEENANYIIVDSSLNSNSTNPVQNKIVKQAIDSRAPASHNHVVSEITDIAKVAKTGNYNDLTNKPTIPTKVSQLINDKSYVRQSELPTKLSTFENDSGFIDTTVDNLVNYYTKTNSYSKTEVNNLINTIPTMSIKIVDSLPETGNSKYIYLISADITENNNYYNEFLWTGSAYEKIGSTKINLDGYLTKTGDSSNTATQFTIAKSRVLPQSGEILSVIFGKVVKYLNDLNPIAFSGSFNDLQGLNGKGLSTNDYTTAEKTKLSGISENANNYTLPVGGSTIGGVKNGGDIAISSDGKMTISNSKVIAEKIANSTITKVKLSNDVQNSLSKADTALQSETDPTVPAWAKATSKPTYTAEEVGAASSNHTHNYAGSSSAGGAATSANKLTTARSINGMNFNGTTNIVNYGTCSTAAATVAKTVACDNFTLTTGAEITVKFTVTNTAASPTLNVNGTGAKAIYYRGSTISAGYLAANRTYTFRYNGTQYELVGDINTDSNTNTAHSHSAGVGLTGSGNAGTSGTYTYKVNLVNETAASNEASYTAGGTSKFYAVQLDKNNKLGVYVPWTDNNTTYDSMSVSEGTTGTATTNRVLTAANLKSIINAHAPTKTGSGASGTWGIDISGNAATSTKATQDSIGQQINTTYIKGLSVSGKTITYTRGDDSTGTITTQDTNTTYQAGAGISLSGTTFSNSGVRSIATGSANGTISVNTNGTSTDVAVKGLGTAAYTASSAYISSSSGAVKATNIASGAVSTSYTATISTSWTGSEAPYTQSITVSGILASDTPIIDIVPSSTYATAQAQEEAWSKIYRITTANNAITIYAHEKAEVEIPIKMVVIRK